jgi:endoglycosylceramidase
MKRILPWFVLIPVLLTAACGSSEVPLADPASADPKSTPVQLRRDGRFMVDDKNRVVLLHGVNAVWKLKPYYPPQDAAGFAAADADWLRDHGFNTVRLGTIFAGVMPDEGRIDQDYLRAVDRVVQLLASRGIWVMLDFHQDMYNERFGGEGFPDWAVHDDGIPSDVSFGFPGNYFHPATTRAFDNFWDNGFKLWDHYRDAWIAVAAKWKHQPYLMGYDLLNEPYPGSDFATCANPVGCPVFDDMELQAMQSHVLAGIRTVDAGNLVWFEPNFVFNGGAKSGLGVLTPLTDPNLGFSWHKYCLSGVVLHSQGFEDLPGCDQWHQIVTDNAEETRETMNATTLVTEFGASDDLADLEQVTRQTDTQFTGWQYWHYKEWGDPTTESQESGGQGLFTDDADLNTVKVEKLKMLERTYPQYTAGIPVAGSLIFDPASAEFHYRYTPRAARGPTEIYVPVLHYPNGYRVEVSGAQQKSAAGADRLVLENIPGATEVSVTITRL